MVRRAEKPAGPATAPQSIEAEEAVIGSVLVRQSALHEAGQYIVSDDFYRHAHQLVYRACTRLDLAGLPVDLVTLIDDLRSHGELADVGGAAWVAELAERVPTAANVAAYARTVREKSIRRKLIANATELANRAREDADMVGVEDVLAGLVTADTAVIPVPTMPEMVEGAVRQIEETASGRRESCVMSGLGALDRMLGGIPIGWQCVFVARPRLGKSALTRTIAHNALRRGEPVGIVDLEMRREGLLRAMLSRESGIPAKRLRMGQLAEREWSLLAMASQRVSHYPLHIHDGDNSWGKIKLVMRRWVDAGCRLIVIDYLSKVEPDVRTGSPFVDVGRLAYEAHDFAHKFGVALLLVVQQNRDAPKDKDKRPKLHHLRESGSIEQAADLVVALYRPSEFDKAADPRDVECWVLKAKDSETGMIPLLWIPETMEFADADYRPEEPAPDDLLNWGNHGNA